MHKLKNEFLQIGLLKQMRIILDPKAHKSTLFKAGISFVKLLYGESYQPSEEEISSVVHLVCSNPDIPL